MRFREGYLNVLHSHQSILEDLKFYSDIYNSERITKKFSDQIHNRLKKQTLFAISIIVESNILLDEGNDIILLIKRKIPSDFQWRKTELKDIISRLETIESKLNVIKNTFEKFVPEFEENSIQLKINSQNLDDIIRDLKDSQLALSQTILSKEIGGKLEIRNFDNGSLWVEIALGTQAAVSLIGSIAWSAAVIYKKLNEAIKIREQYKGIITKNETLENLSKAVKDQAEIMTRVEAEAIHNKYYKSKDNNEQVERIRHSIKTLSELLIRGTEIHPSLNESKNMKSVFPDYTKLDEIESKLFNQLGEKESDSE